MNAAKKIFVLWFVLLCTVYGHAVVIEALGTHICKSFSIGYDSVTLENAGYDNPEKMPWAYDEAPMHNATEREKAADNGSTLIVFTEFFAADTGVWSLGPATRGQTLGLYKPTMARKMPRK